MLSLDAVPSTVTLRAAAPAPTSISATCSTSLVSGTESIRGASIAGSISSGSGMSSASTAGQREARARSPARAPVPARAAGTISGAVSRATSGEDRTAGPRRGHAQQLAGRNRARGEQQGRQRRDQHDRQLLRIGRGVGNGGARDDAAVGRRRLDVFARVRLAVFGEIGFQQIALRLGLALERAELHVLAVVRGRLLLQLVEARRSGRRPGRRRGARRSPASGRSCSPPRATGDRDRQAAPSIP